MADRGKSTHRAEDIGWEHFEVVDVQKRRVKCKWCHRIMSGGISRGKEHLGGIKGNVMICPKVPEKIRVQFNQHIRGIFEVML